MKFIFFLLPFVFFLQTRTPIANQFHGNDYEIIYVYVRDLVVLGFIGAGISFHAHAIWKWLLPKKWFLVWLVVFFVCTLVSSFSALSVAIALYRTLIIGVYGVFAITLGWYLQTKNKLSSWLMLWVVPFVCIACMAVYEIVSGQSLGLWVVGNWDFSVLTPGIARIHFFGHTLLRPYTVFPHPNVLGGIALVFLFLFVTFLPAHEKLGRFSVRHIGIFCGWLLVLISFSRSAWVGGILGLVTVLIQKRNEVRVPRWVFILGVSSLVIVIPYISQVSVHDPAISERLELMKRSWDMILEQPLLGVGNGNFTLALKDFRTAERQILLQPVHVVWLLIASEAGIITAFIYVMGWVAILGVLLRNREDTQSIVLVAIWGVIGIIGFADHYWWSLSVGNAVWWLIVGLSLSMIQSKESL